MHLVCFCIVLLIIQSSSWSTYKYWKRRVSLKNKLFNTGTGTINEVEYGSSPTIYEINKKFLLPNVFSKKILDNSSAAAGNVGIILNLETSLVDTSRLMGYSFAILAGELKQPTLSPSQIKASLGSPFIDQITSFGWKVPDTVNILAIEQRLYSIIENLINKLPISPYQGAKAFIYDILNQRNDIIILSSLPRTLSKKILGGSGLSELLEGRISSHHLICLDKLTGNPSIDMMAHPVRINAHREHYFLDLLIKSCMIMQKSPILCTLVDGNHDNLVTAKRNGFNCIALTELTGNSKLLKCADIVIPNLDTLTIKDVYRVTARSIQVAAGPERQTATTPQSVRKVRTLERIRTSYDSDRINTSRSSNTYTGNSTT